MLDLARDGHVAVGARSWEIVVGLRPTCGRTRRRHEHSPGVEELVDRLREHHVIVVLLTRYLGTSLDLDYIGADNERIGREATQHLIQLGHTRMVHFAGTDSSTGHDRAFGYVRSCHACRKTRAVADRPSWPSSLHQRPSAATGPRPGYRPRWSSALTGLAKYSVPHVQVVLQAHVILLAKDPQLRRRTLDADPSSCLVRMTISV